MKIKEWSRSDKIALIATVITIIGVGLALITPEARKCIGLDPGGCPFIPTNKSESDSSEVVFMTEEIPVNSWREIPGTYSKTSHEAFGETNGSIYILGDKVFSNKEFIVFDMFDTSLGTPYIRVEGDCNNLKWRNVRSGHFQSKTQVKFTYDNENWQKEINQYQKSILNYVCNMSKKGK